jgi:hypothetical protein
MAKARKQAATAKPTEVQFEFLKSNFFRVIHVDGAFGGLSPNGRTIHLAVFSERRAIPTRTVHPIGDGGKLGNEARDRREGSKGFVRELEADLTMDLATAISVQRWLVGKIEEMAKANDVTVDLSTGTIQQKGPSKDSNAAPKAGNGNGSNR